MPEFQIVNVVATADLKQSVSLLDVAKIEYTIFDNKIYGGRVAYLKTPEMHGKVTIFPSGKLISVGTKSPHEAEKDLQLTLKILVHHKLIKPIKLKAHVRNIVAMTTLSQRPDFDKIAEKFSTIYEPEQFPAAIIRLTSPKVSMLVFNSGKIIIAGAKNLLELKQVIEKLQEELNT